MAERVGHYTVVHLQRSTIEEMGYSPAGFPRTMRDGSTIRLGAACRKYLVDEFGLDVSPTRWPDPLPPEVERTLIEATRIAEHWNVKTGRSGGQALVFCDDVAHVLGHDPDRINARYKAAAARPSSQNPLADE